MTDTFDRARLIARLTGDEGSRPLAYDDATGKTIQPGTAVQGWVSIGIGRNLVGKGLSPDEIQYLVNNDITESAALLDQYLPWWRNMDAVRQEALLDLSFMGIGGLLGFHRMLTDLEDEKWESAASELANSKYATQVGQRAVRLEAMIRTGAETV